MLSLAELRRRRLAAANSTIVEHPSESQAETSADDNDNDTNLAAVHIQQQRAALEEELR